MIDNAQMTLDPMTKALPEGDMTGTEKVDDVAPVAGPTLEESLAQLPDHIGYDFRPNPESDELVITLSPSKTYLMSATEFNRNVLLLTDRRGSYYTLKAAHVAKALRGVAERFKKIIFIGSSKGGYGAILLAGLCAQRDRKRPYYCMAFSPQTSLHPENKTLRDLPSYQGLLQRKATNAGLRICVEKFGDLTFVQSLSNLYILLIYSEEHSQDVGEAARLCSPNIRKYPVPFSLHASILPFNLRSFARPDVQRRIQMLYRTKVSDPDLAATLPDEWEKVVDWIVLNRWVPPLLTLLEEMVAVPLMGRKR